MEVQAAEDGKRGGGGSWKKLFQSIEANVEHMDNWLLPSNQYHSAIKTQGIKEET